LNWKAVYSIGETCQEISQVAVRRSELATIISRILGDSRLG